MVDDGYVPALRARSRLNAHGQPVQFMLLDGGDRRPAEDNGEVQVSVVVFDFDREDGLLVLTRDMGAALTLPQTSAGSPGQAACAAQDELERLGLPARDVRVACVTPSPHGARVGCAADALGCAPDGYRFVAFWDALKLLLPAHAASLDQIFAAQSADAMTEIDLAGELR